MCVFVCRLIQHTKALMSAEEKLCIKVLRILQEMLIRTLDFDEKVSSNSRSSLNPVVPYKRRTAVESDQD